MQIRIIDRDGIEHGPFKTPLEAGWYAKSRWPDQEQSEEHIAGWDAEIPDETN